MNFAKTLGLTFVTVTVLALSGYAFADDLKGKSLNVNDETSETFLMPRGFEGATGISRIAEVLKHAHDDDRVIVKGKLTKFIGGDKYLLTDEYHDKIVIELDKGQDWSHLTKDMTIVVYAKVDADGHKHDHHHKVLEVIKARPYALTDHS